MKLSWNEIKSNAIKFSIKWKNTNDESSEAQSFLNDFFEVFGVDRKRVANFEKKVPMGKGHNGYIDLLWKGVILIEMKSKGKSLDKAYYQAKDYAFNLEDEDLPEYTMICDFENIRLYRNTTNQIWNFKTSQLYKNIKLFSDIAGYKAPINIPTDKEVDVHAAEKMAKLHDILKAHAYEGHYLEVYLVRLLFCLFADDTGIFEKNIFFDYVSNSKKDGTDLSYRLAKLFEILDTPFEKREKEEFLSDELTRFEYINGSLYKEILPLADFDSHMRKILLDCCSLHWSYISPAIFGAIFQGVKNPHERRELGAHYTSEENILKVIKPLFLNDLVDEFEHIKGNSKKLEQFHKKLSNLKFLDPACGCGNFLIITYREIRLLELEVLKMLIDTGGQMILDISPYCLVNVNQFYGIELEEFPGQIAKVGMWLIDHQMNNLVAEHFGLPYNRLPLKQSATIVNENALSFDWESIVPKNELNYILGNPPFIGKKYQNKKQKEDMLYVFGKKFKGLGTLDYVSAWYKKASDFIKNTNIKVAFVSTNSIVQGEQVPTLWKPLFERNQVHFDFAYRTFVWSNEAKRKAAVHCVIIGFSSSPNERLKNIYDGDQIIKAKNISPYLTNGETIFVESRRSPLSAGDRIVYGSFALDDGNYTISELERLKLIEEDKDCEKYIRKFLGSDELINSKPRYCIWLKGANPKDIQNCKSIIKKVNAVQKWRLKSRRKETIKAAQTPSLFAEIRQPEGPYLAIPITSSERRRYIPMKFLSNKVIASNHLFIIPNATVYHFGILISSVHMAWMRMIAGRLKSDYNYSASIVYNNFPWPNPTDEQKKLIEKEATGVLNARNLYPDDSLATLYDPLIMPPELVKAHNNLDKAVITAYGGRGFETEEECVAKLMKKYQQLANISLIL